MNIRQAKEEVAHAVEVYLAKDDNGLYLIPVERQRPLFLLGAPGLGHVRRSHIQRFRIHHE